MFYIVDARQRQEVNQRAKVALVVYAQHLLDAARDLRWEYNPAILHIGRDLLRDPSLESLYPRQMLRDIYADMNGREEMYCQIGDLMDLLAQQQVPITPEDRRDVAWSLSKSLGVRVPEQCLVGWMTERECETAITSLVASVPPAGLDAGTERVWRQSVPLVLSTARMPHRLPNEAGRTMSITPMQLSPEALLRWFRERLILATRVTLERFPDNPLWMAPDGSIQGAQHPTFQRLHYREWEELIERVCAPVKRGRRMGSGGRFRDAQDFRETIIRDLRALRQQGCDETQLELACLWYESDADPTAEVDSLVASTKRYCRRYGYTWETLVAQARQ